MIKDFIIVEDNVFSKNECDELISKYLNKTFKSNRDDSNYNFFDIRLDDFRHIEKINNVVEKYKNNFDEIDMTASVWGLDNLRFKHFEPNRSFANWHSEHCFSYPNRVLSLQIYLSSHNCGTEFYNGRIIKSEIGRVALFPAYFTHTHKGQVCPDNKDRYIITGYYNFYQKGINE